MHREIRSEQVFINQEPSCDATDDTDDSYDRIIENDESDKDWWLDEPSLKHQWQKHPNVQHKNKTSGVTPDCRIPEIDTAVRICKMLLIERFSSIYFYRPSVVHRKLVELKPSQQ